MGEGKPPDEDITINILWMSMGLPTKAHVTGKVDMDSVSYAELRQIVQSYANLINSTSSRGKGNGVVPMDISSIASSLEWSRERMQRVGGSFHADGSCQDDEPPSPQPLSSLTCDESGWPIDEEGWRLDGHLI